MRCACFVTSGFHVFTSGSVMIVSSFVVKVTFAVVISGVMRVTSGSVVRGGVVELHLGHVRLELGHTAARLAPHDAFPSGSCSGKEGNDSPSDVRYWYVYWDLPHETRSAWTLQICLQVDVRCVDSVTTHRKSPRFATQKPRILDCCQWCKLLHCPHENARMNTLFSANERCN